MTPVFTPEMPWGVVTSSMYIPGVVLRSVIVEGSYRRAATLWRHAAHDPGLTGMAGPTCDLAHTASV